MQGNVFRVWKLTFGQCWPCDLGVSKFVWCWLNVVFQFLNNYYVLKVYKLDIQYFESFVYLHCTITGSNMYAKWNKEKFVFSIFGCESSIFLLFSLTVMLSWPDHMFNMGNGLTQCYVIISCLFSILHKTSNQVAHWSSYSGPTSCRSFHQ